MILHKATHILSHSYKLYNILMHEEQLLWHSDVHNAGKHIFRLKLLRQSTVSAPIGFISEAVDDQVETAAMK